MHVGHDILAAVQSQNVQQAPAGGGRIQHGVVATGTWIPLGDGTEDDLSMTVQSYIGNSGAYFDDEGEQAIPSLCTVVVTAIGDFYAPTGEQRTLMLATERGWGVLFEHGFEEISQSQPTSIPFPGERYILHRSAPQNGNYADAVYDAGLRLLNDGPTTGDGLGTTELGFQGAHTAIVTKGGWLIDEDDTAEKLSIYFPNGDLALVCNANTGKVEFSGSTGASGDALVRESDLATFASTLQAWAAANLAHGTSSPPTPATPPCSPLSFSG